MNYFSQKQAEQCLPKEVTVALMGDNPAEAYLSVVDELRHYAGKYVGVYKLVKVGFVEAPKPFIREVTP